MSLKVTHILHQCQTLFCGDIKCMWMKFVDLSLVHNMDASRYATVSLGTRLGYTWHVQFRVAYSRDTMQASIYPDHLLWEEVT